MPGESFNTKTATGTAFAGPDTEPSAPAYATAPVTLSWVHILSRVVVLTVILVTLDMIWFNFVYKKVYAKMFKAINEPINKGDEGILRKPGLVAAYILLAIAIYYFALQQPIQNGSNDATGVFSRGALVGLLIYGVYNATNYASRMAHSI